MLKCLEGKQDHYQHSSSFPFYTSFHFISFFFNDFHSIVPRLFNINNLKSYLLVLLLPGQHHTEPLAAGSAGRNVTVTKGFRRNAYHMEAEVCITFPEFGKMQNMCNFLIEKLGSSAVISQLQFCYTPSSVENLRWQGCLVVNVWCKAQEVYNLVGQTHQRRNKRMGRLNR